MNGLSSVSFVALLGSTVTVGSHEESCHKLSTDVGKPEKVGKSLACFFSNAGSEANMMIWLICESNFLRHTWQFGSFATVFRSS